MVMNDKFEYGVKKTCIFYSYDNFSRLLDDIGKYAVQMDYDDMCFYSLVTGEDVPTSKIIQKISQKYNIFVTSIHYDQFIDTGFWVVYQKANN